MRWLLAVLLIACTTNVYVVNPTPDAATDSGVEAEASAPMDAASEADAVVDAGPSDAFTCAEPKTNDECPDSSFKVACSSKVDTFWQCTTGNLWALQNCQGNCPPCTCADGGL